MAPPRSPKVFLIAGTFLGLALTALPASAQQIPTPGVTPEAVREWTWYLAFPLALGVLGFLGLIGLSYLRLSSRFFGKEEPPELPQPRRRRVVGAMAAPAPVGPRVEQLGAASTTPPIPAAASVKTAAEQQPVPESARAPERPAAAAAPAATKTAPAPAAASTEAPAAPSAPAPAAAPEHVEPDQETYERELQAQLDKGADRRVAEGRAKAAGVRAARAKAAGAQSAAPAAPSSAQPAMAPTPPPKEEGAQQPTPGGPEQKPKQEIPSQEGGGEPTPPPEDKVASAPPEEARKDAAEASAQRQATEREPTVPPPDSPAAEAEQAEEAPKQVDAPAPPREEPAAETPPAKAPPGADKETFDRVLKEQLDKGLAQPIAESRARAAAIRAAREKADAG